MTLQTGGFAVGEISTRSRSFSRAMSCACCSGTTPIWEPSAPMRRTSGMPRIISLILDSGSAGLRSKRDPRRGGKMRKSSCCTLRGSAKSTNKPSQSQRAGVDHPLRFGDEFINGHRGLIASCPLPDRHPSGRHFLLAYYQHVRGFLQLRVADFRAELLIQLVRLDPQTGRAKLGRCLAPVVEELL